MTPRGDPEPRRGIQNGKTMTPLQRPDPPGRQASPLTPATQRRGDADAPRQQEEMRSSRPRVTQVRGALHARIGGGMRATQRSSGLLACVAALALVSSAIVAKAIPDRPAPDKRPVPVSTPRVAPVPEGQWTAAQKQLVAKFSRDGKADNQMRTLLNVPEIVEGIMPFTIYIAEESSLMPRHRELLILRTAWLTASQAIWATHALRAKQVGLTTDEIQRAAQGPETAGWLPFEKTLIQMADQLYRNSAVSDATWKALSAQFDLEHMMDAVETVNHFTFLSYLNNSFGVQPDEGLGDRMPTNLPYRINVAEPEPPLKVARVEPLAGTGIAVGRTFARHAKLNQPRGGRA